MIQEIKNEILGESYFSIQHATGLTVLVYPKKDMPQPMELSTPTMAP